MPVTIDLLTEFGALSMAAMLVFYTVENRSAAFVRAFAVACLASSAYGFLQGAWPFGVVELIWSGVALRRWRNRHGAARPEKTTVSQLPSTDSDAGASAGWLRQRHVPA